MPSTNTPDPLMSFTTQQKQQLLELAWRTIRLSVESGIKPRINTTTCDAALQQHGACFVTIYSHPSNNVEKQLRGCIGTLKAYQPLVVDVIEHAYAAAMRDPRFPPINTMELNHLELDISVLTPEVPIECSSEQELLEQLTPFKDGLSIEDGVNKATFLPSVWDQLPNKQDFLNHLRLKAGMSKDHWSEQFKAYKYQTLIITAENSV